MSIAFQKQELRLRGFGKNGSPRTSQAKQRNEVVHLAAVDSDDDEMPTEAGHDLC
jgi:hypothetical protein